MFHRQTHTCCLWRVRSQWDALPPLCSVSTAIAATYKNTRVKGQKQGFLCKNPCNFLMFSLWFLIPMCKKDYICNLKHTPINALRPFSVEISLFYIGLFKFSKSLCFIKVFKCPVFSLSGIPFQHLTCDMGTTNTHSFQLRSTTAPKLNNCWNNSGEILLDKNKDNRNTL